MTDWPEVIRRIEAHMAREEQRAAMCEGKFGFASAVQAYEHGRSPAWADQAHVYHCPFCSLFHVGRNGPAKRSRGTGYLRSRTRYEMSFTRERR